MSALLVGLEPWTGRLIPCWVEAGWLVTQCGPVSRNAPLVAPDEATASYLRGLGYWNVPVNGGTDNA